VAGAGGASDPPKERTEFSLDCGIVGFEHPGPWHYDNIESWPGRVSPEGFPEPALGEVPPDGAADLPRRGNPEAALDEGVRKEEHRQESPVSPPALFVDSLELRPVVDALPGPERLRHTSFLGHRSGAGPLGRRHAQALAALGPATLQDQAAVLRAHSNEEAVGTAATAAVRLKCAFHG
jgi:hypothetical protein